MRLTKWVPRGKDTLSFGNWAFAKIGLELRANRDDSELFGLAEICVRRNRERVFADIAERSRGVGEV